MVHIDLSPDLDHGALLDVGSVFRNRSFLLLWASQLLSQLASNMVLAALMATVVAATGSNTANAVLILTFLVPALAFSAIAGVLPRIVKRHHLMAANSVFVLTVTGTFAVGFGFLGPLLLTTAGAVAVYVVVAIMFGLAALAIIPLPAVQPEVHGVPSEAEASRALRAVFEQVREGLAFVQSNPKTAWSLIYLGIASSVLGVMGAIGPGFATDILRLRPADFFFVMGPAGIGAVVGILFVNAYGKNLPRRLLIDSGLLAMGEIG